MAIERDDAEKQRIRARMERIIAGLPKPDRDRAYAILQEYATDGNISDEDAKKAGRMICNIIAKHVHFMEDN